MRKVRIGGGQGFWGDSNDAAIHMMKHGGLDYMACDYLAELTLSIMARQKLKNPQRGYAADFVELFKNVVKESHYNKTGILTNAGGMNVLGAVDACRKVCVDEKIKGYRIGYILGDNIKRELPELIKEGIEFDNLDDSGLKLKDIMSDIVNANVYFGHEPILECLDKGADLVLTGRATDSALFLAPIMKKLGWDDSDLNKMARGIMAGHLLECGGQGSGGNFQYGWRNVPDMDRLGFPVAEVSDEFLHITKAPDCGGIITEQTCKEQFLYEVHDPANYITPDVTVDISKAQIVEIEKNLVDIRNIKGRKKPDKLKLNIGYHAGYKVVAYLCYAWPDAYEKAQYAAQIILKKMQRKGLKAEEIRIDYVGLNALHLDVADMTKEMCENVNEVILRIAIRTLTKEEAYKLVPEISPLQLNGPPGASFFGGRAKVEEVIGLWPTLIPRDALHLKTYIVDT